MGAGAECKAVLVFTSTRRPGDRSHFEGIDAILIHFFGHRQVRGNSSNLGREEMGGLISIFCENVENKAELLNAGLFFFFFFWHQKNSLEFWLRHIFHGVQAGRCFLLNTGKEKITGSLPTASGLMGHPLKCQLWSNTPAALMIYRNSSVYVSELSLWERLWCLWESDDSRAVLQLPKAFFYFDCLVVTM